MTVPDPSHTTQPGLVLTLVAANPGSGADSGVDLGAALDAAAGSLDNAGAGVGDSRILTPGVAADLPFQGLTASSAERIVRDGLPSAFDLAVQPDGPERRKKILIADMESTVIHNEMLDELGVLAGERRGGSEIADRIRDVTARAMRGELDFEAALRERVALLEGMTVDDLEEARRKIVIDPGAAALVKTMKENGALTALVSGGFTYFADKIAEQLGFDVCQANELEIVDGRLTGRVVPPILDRGAKLTALEKLASERGLTPADAVAVGDGSNDLAMIQAAGLGVAFHAKPIVAEAAGFRVEHGDLRALLAFQGYEAF